jgi:hypothetical protein
MEDKPTTFPTWGYKDDGSAQIFDLREEDGDLPDGWSRQIEPWNHPNSRHLHSRPAEAPASPQEDLRDPEEPRKRGPGRPRSTGQAPGTSAIELRDE